MEKMNPLLNLNDLSLEDLESLEASLQTAINKKYQERKEKAFSEFREAYEKFRKIFCKSSIYVDVFCAEYEQRLDIDLINLLDSYFDL